MTAVLKTPHRALKSVMVLVLATVSAGFALFAETASHKSVDLSPQGLSTPDQAAIVVDGLKTENASSPLGIDTRHPRFRWLLKSDARSQLQSAYQILVASSPEKLQADTGDKWDSQKIASDNSVEVPYEGKDLTSGEKCYWKVRIWDQNGHPSSYSNPASFEMGLLDTGDWKGSWIEAEKGVSSPLLRREFRLNAEVRRARLYISGIGWSEASINGQRIGDRVLDPASTMYHVDPSYGLHSRILYTTYDVTSSLKIGQNVFGVMLGHGWYSSEVPTVEVVFRRAPDGDRPVLKAQLEVELVNGEQVSVVSDNSWKTSPGPIVYNDLANGESYDARREQLGWNSPSFDDSTWQPVQIANSPSGILVSQVMPPERVVQTLQLVKILDPKEPELFEYARVYDFGQLFSGWTRLTVSGPRGSKVRLQYVSRIDPLDNTPDERSNQSPVWEARQTDTYVLKGTGTEVWEPHFTLHGFRYVEVRTTDDKVVVQNLEGRFVHSDLEETGSLETSNNLINEIHRNIRWTLMTSFQGIPQDAAERAERTAPVGDVGFVADAYFYNYDMALFWEKWLDDIKDSQNADGGISFGPPDHGLVGNAQHEEAGPEAQVWPAFQSAYPLLVSSMYRYYGDKRVLEQHYNCLKKLASFEHRAAKDDLIADEPLGDHMEPQENGFSSFYSRHTPHALTANAYYYYTVATIARIAEVLGHTDEAVEYQRHSQHILEVFNHNFFHSDTNQYGSGSQTSNALPLYLGMVPKENIAAVVKNLADEIVVKHAAHVTTGIIGSNAVVQALPMYGESEVMYKLANQTTYPSLGDQVLKGATAICESYECGPWLSQNMKMFTGIDRFFYANLAGITPAAPGYRRVTIQPQPVGNLTSVSATEQTVRGPISVSWNRQGKSLTMKISIPAGVEADIVLPKLEMDDVSITEGGNALWQSGQYRAGIQGIIGADKSDSAVTIRSGSGTYDFEINGR